MCQRVNTGESYIFYFGDLYAVHGPLLRVYLKRPDELRGDDKTATIELYIST